MMATPRLYAIEDGWSSLISLAFLLYLVFFLSFVYCYVIYPVFISPLSKLPSAHPTSSFLPTWFWYQGHTQRESYSVLKAHQKHGPIVRLAPNEVSVASLDGLRKVYLGRRFIRTPWTILAFKNYGENNLVTLTDSTVHAARKKTMLQVYVKTAVMRSPDFMKLSAIVLLDRLLPVLENAARMGHRLDVYELFRAVAVEMGSAYEVGIENGLDLVRPGREGARKKYLAQCKAKIDEGKGHDVPKKWLEDQMLVMCMGADAQLKDQTEQTDEKSTRTYPVAYAQLAAAIAEEYPTLSMAAKNRIVASELLDNLEANREGSGFVSTYALCEMSQRPILQQELRAQLRALSPRFPSRYSQDDPITTHLLQSIDRLPLLDAIVKETLRLYPPTPGPQRRDVPPGGVTVEGYYIPAGTTISTSQRALHMNEDVFPNAERWLPERWLRAKDEKTHDEGDPSRWWWVFGSGARSCSGKDFATLSKCSGARTQD